MSKRPVFVVISGKKQHGKNFFANKVKDLLRQHGISYTETAFARPIKIFCHEVFGIDMDDMETESGKQKKTHLKWGDLQNAGDYAPQEKWDDYITLRELLQIIGTELFREQFYGPIWAEAPFLKKHTYRAFLGEYEHALPAQVVFITDCRFPNEVAEAKKHDAIMVRVIREDPPVETDNHASETALDDYEWEDHEVVIAATDDGRLDAYANEVLLPKILGRLHGQ